MNYLFVIFQIKYWWLGKDVCLNKLFDSVRKKDHYSNGVDWMANIIWIVTIRYHLCDGRIGVNSHLKKCTAWVKPIMYWYEESRAICSWTKMAFYNILERKRESLSSEVDTIDFWWQAKMLCTRESMRESWINKVAASC